MLSSRNTVYTMVFIDTVVFSVREDNVIHKQVAYVIPGPVKKGIRVRAISKTILMQKLIFTLFCTTYCAGFLLFCTMGGNAFY